jgi:hypothetical protein
MGHADCARLPRRSARRSGQLNLSGCIIVPPNITLVSLPAKSPELNPRENVCQTMRENWLSK